LEEQQGEINIQSAEISSISQVIFLVIVLKRETNLKKFKK